MVEGLTWVDWVGVSSGVLSVLGLGFAYWQLRRTAKAATAARDAIERTERRLALNQILVIVPQLLAIEQDWKWRLMTTTRGLLYDTFIGGGRWPMSEGSIDRSG
jgi:hypothetical protein